LTDRDSQGTFCIIFGELLVSATLALLMILVFVLITLFMVILEQVTDRRSDRKFEQQLAAWRVQLQGRYRSGGA